LYIRCSRGNFGRQTSVVRRNVDQLRANTRADRRFPVAQKILKRSDAAKLVLIDKFGVEHVSDDRFMELVRDVLAGTRARVADRRRCPRTPLYPPRRVVSRDGKLVWCAHAKRLPAGHRLPPACRSLSLHDRDVELHGEKLRAGDVVLFLYASANRDPREFPDPDTFDIARRPPRILSFGHGTHACLGIHVAKAEGRIALEELLRRDPEYEIDLAGAERLRTEFVQGFARLPVRLRRQP